jgi:hypothetical protein
MAASLALLSWADTCDAKAAADSPTTKTTRSLFALFMIHLPLSTSSRTWMTMSGGYSSHHRNARTSHIRAKLLDRGPISSAVSRQTGVCPLRSLAAARLDQCRGRFSPKKQTLDAYCTWERCPGPCDPAMASSRRSKGRDRSASCLQLALLSGHVPSSARQLKGSPDPTRGQSRGAERRRGLQRSICRTEAGCEIRSAATRVPPDVLPTPPRRLREHG